MKIKEASHLYKALSSESFDSLKGAKFNYALIRNQAILKNELAFIEAKFKADPEFLKFSKERYDLLTHYSQKDEKGNPVIENDTYKIQPDLDAEFKEKTKELQEKYSDTLDKRDKQMEEFDAMVEEEIGFELHKIPLDAIPQEITKEQMELLMPLIKEE